MRTDEWAEAFPRHQINGATKFLFQEIDQRDKVPEIFLPLLEDNKDVVVTALLIITPTNGAEDAKLGNTEFAEVLSVVVYHLEEFSPSGHAE